jgi:hypothetical protein
MTRRIAVEIGNATAHHCKWCPHKVSSIIDSSKSCGLFDYKKLTKTMNGDVNRCTACRKAEIREEVGK